MNRARKLLIAGACALLLPATWGSVSAADLDEQTWREECSACHIAYPARFLPAASWKAIIETLQDHFDTDASVDAATAESISRYLTAAARSPARTQSAPSSLRITETRWFLHEHDEITSKQWRKPKVKSAANCGACHEGAQTGRFSEESVHIPE